MKKVRSSFHLAFSELENMWNENWTKLPVNRIPLSELWDKKSLHTHTSAPDHMLLRFLLEKKLILQISESTDNSLAELQNANHKKECVKYIIKNCLQQSGISKLATFYTYMPVVDNQWLFLPPFHFRQYYPFSGFTVLTTVPNAIWS